MYCKEFFLPNKKHCKKATASVPSPVINIKTHLLKSNGNAPDVKSFYEIVKETYVFFQYK